jgi:nucleotide-binding universal stress UspA family protein
MAAAAKGATVARVLVALDGSKASCAAVAEGAELAAAHGAELCAVFVVDDEILELCERPLAVELTLPLGRVQVPDRHSLERRLRAEAAALRRAVRRAAERRSLQWRFDLLRGKVDARLAEATAGADVLVIGRTGKHASMAGRCGGTVRRLVGCAERTVYVHEPRAPARGPAVVPYDCSPAAENSLATAHLIAARLGLNLVVLVSGREPAAALVKSLDGLSPALPAGALLAVAGANDPDALLRHAASLQPRLLVLPATAAWLEDDRIRRALEGLACTVVYAR